jgi:hypothetical protein
MQTTVNAPTSATINPQTEVQKILSKTDLDWEVRKEDLVAKPSDLETPCAGLFRNDTDCYLGVASKNYTIYQNKELVDMIMEAAKHFDLEIANGGWLFNGENVYLQLELPSVYVGNSEVKRYITAMNSHNGKGSVAFGATNDIFNITPNGVETYKFFQVFREMDKFRHTQTVHTRVNNAIQGLFASITKENKTTILMQKMANLKVKDELLREIMFNCYKVDLNKSIADLPTRTQNRIKEISRKLEGEIDKQDGSMWGLFQGVLKNTEYSTPKKISKDENVYAGSGRAVNVKAFNIIKNFIEKNNN